MRRYEWYTQNNPYLPIKIGIILRSIQLTHLEGWRHCKSGGPRLLSITVCLVPDTRGVFAGREGK